MLITILLLLIAVLAQMVEMRWRSKPAPPPPLADPSTHLHNEAVMQCLSQLTEMKKTVEASTRSGDVASQVTDARVAALQKMVASLRLPEPIIPVMGATLDLDTPPVLSDTQTMHLYENGIATHEVAWHRPEMPSLHTYGGKTYVRQGQRVDGIWEYQYVS